MQQSCQKCGAEVNPEQAFCSKCGAVVGMGDADARKGGDEWDMASTFVSKKPGAAPAHRPGATGERARSVSAERSANPPAPAAPQAPTPAPAPVPARGGNTMLYALIGFVAVLIAGGLLILLFYLNSRG